MKGQVGPDWRNSNYYKGNYSEMDDIIWNLKSQLNETQRENSMLRLQLNQIRSILDVQ